MFSEPGLLLLSQSPGAQEGLTGWPPAGSVHPEKHYVLDFRETVMSATKEAGGGVLPLRAGKVRRNLRRLHRGGGRKGVSLSLAWGPRGRLGKG